MEREVMVAAAVVGLDGVGGEKKGVSARERERMNKLGGGRKE